MGTIVGLRDGVLNLSPAVESDPNLATLMGLSNLRAFFDPDWTPDGVSLRNSGGVDYLTALHDRTGSYTVSQANTAAQPVWGALTPTGRRVATYAAASNQCLIGAEGLGSTGMGSFSILTLVKFTSLAATRALWSFGYSSTAERFQLQVSPTGQLSLYRTDGPNGVGTVAQSAASAIGTANYHQVTVTFDSTTSTGILRIDGVQVATGSAVRSPTLNLFGIGCAVNGGVGTNPMDGVIGPVVVTGSVLSGSPLTAAENAIVARYKEAA